MTTHVLGRLEVADDELAAAVLGEGRQDAAGDDLQSRAQAHAQVRPAAQRTQLTCCKQFDLAKLLSSSCKLVVWQLIHKNNSIN